MEPIRIQLILPFHHPLSATTEELRLACEEFYTPFFDEVERWPTLRLTLHFSGHLLDHFAREREDLLDRLRDMHDKGKIEILGGLFYGGIPTLLPETDIRGQLDMSAQFWTALLGEAPDGFWLPELAWNSEIPRLLADTELLYGFASASQMLRERDPSRGFGVFERESHRVAVFLLDDGLSRVLPSLEGQAFVDSMMFRAAGEALPVISVWSSGTRLGFEAGTRSWAFTQGKLRSFFDAVCDTRADITLVLPGESYDKGRAGDPLKLAHGVADVLGVEAMWGYPADWTDFQRRYSEVDTLLRRMLRASDRCGEAVAWAQDEGGDGQLNDMLTTAQRLIFAAQMPDAYWRGRGAGFSDPAIRSATYQRLVRAEALLDNLVEGQDDFIGAEEEDRDGDLADEVFVSNRYVTLWVDIAGGGNLRSFDDRDHERTLLDVGVRRPEAFFPQAAEAPHVGNAELEARGPRQRLEPLPRREPRLALTADGIMRRGTRDWALDVGVSAAEFFSGSALDLFRDPRTIRVRRNEIDEAGDYCFHLEIENEADLIGMNRRRVRLRKHLRVPADDASFRLDYAIECSGRFVFVVELPWRLPAGVLRADEMIRTPTAVELYQRRQLEIQSGDKTAVTIEFSGPFDVWAQHIATAIRDVDGYRNADQGLVVAVVVPVEGTVEFSIHCRVASDSPHSQARPATDVDHGATGGDCNVDDSSAAPTDEGQRRPTQAISRSRRGAAAPSSASSSSKTRSLAQTA